MSYSFLVLLCFVKVKEKETTIVQIDGILNTFSIRNGIAQISDKLSYYNENTQLNDIIKTKDSLVSVVGTLKVDLFNSKKVINDNTVILNIKNNKSINGKMKMNLNLSLSLTQDEAIEIVLANEQVIGYLDGKTPKKMIFVKGKIVNIVV